MKGFLKLLEVIIVIISVFWTLIEIFTIPALFAIIGVLNDFSRQYYLITIGGYFIVAIVIQLLCHFVFKRFEKRYESSLTRLFTKISKKDTTQE